MISCDAMTREIACRLAKWARASWWARSAGAVLREIAVTMAKHDGEQPVKMWQQWSTGVGGLSEGGAILQRRVGKEALEGVGCNVTCAEQMKQRSSSLAGR
jgi:hypothetical protein